jgi:hypothetical protein
MQSVVTLLLLFAPFVVITLAIMFLITTIGRETK